MFGALNPNHEIQKLVQKLNDEDILRLVLNPPPAPYYMEHVKEEAKERGLL